MVVRAWLLYHWQGIRQIPFFSQRGYFVFTLGERNLTGADRSCHGPSSMVFPCSRSAPRYKCPWSHHHGIVISMTGDLTLSVVPIEKPEDVNVILGHPHFIKTAEDLYEAVAGAVPGALFG